MSEEVGNERPEEGEFWRERADSVARVSEQTEKYLETLRGKGYGRQKQIPTEWWQR